MCIQHSVDCDRIYTKNNTLPISEKVEGETVTGVGGNKGGIGKWVGREGQREWEGKVGVMGRKESLQQKPGNQKVSRHPVFGIRSTYWRSFIE